MKIKTKSIAIPTHRFRTQSAPEFSAKGFVYDALLIENGRGLTHHCTLFLTGTSTRLADVDYFISHLIEREYSVASIERSIGGPFHVLMRPKLERVAALRHFIDHLTNIGKIQRIDIIAR